MARLSRAEPKLFIACKGAKLLSLRQPPTLCCWLPAAGVPTGGPSSLSRYGAATSSILSGVTVPTGHAFYHSSGTVPAVKDPAAPRGSRERYGNTTEQAVSVLTRIGALLAEQGLGFEDSVYVRCYLVADPFLNGTIDTAGWNAAYGMFFNKPGSTRVRGLAGWLCAGSLSTGS